MPGYGVTAEQISAGAQKKLLSYVARASKQTHTGLFAFLRQLFRHRLSIVGASIILIAIFIAVFAPLISPYDPLKIDLRNVYQQPSVSHFIGTDVMGRDELSRVLWGARVSLITGVLATAFSACIGTLRKQGWIRTIFILLFQLALLEIILIVKFLLLNQSKIRLVYLSNRIVR